MGLGKKTWQKLGAEAHELSSATEKTLKVALVCDWLTTPGGAEKVLLELHQLFPDAPIYTSQYSKKGINWFDDATVKTSWLQIFPAGLRKFLGPLRQIYFSHLDLSEYDLVISVTGAEAKAVRTRHSSRNTSEPISEHTKPKRTPKKRPILPLYHTNAKKSSAKAYHLCYCHVPTQYYWQMYDKYVENPGFGFLNPLVRFFFKLLVGPLRKADHKAAQRPDQFVTISDYAREQILQYYGRESVIIAPPVEVDKFIPNLTASKAIGKKFSTAIQAVFHQKSTKTHKLSTCYPQSKGELSTKNTSFSTESAQFSTRNPQENAGLSTKNCDFSTSFPKFLYQKHQSDQVPEIIYPWPPQYYIIACRQVNWKRVDLAIKACKELQFPLLVVGDGPERQKILEIAGEARNIRFIPWSTTEELAQYLQGAKGYIFPSLEPFGIAAVEALAAGCPVIAYKEGGSRDFINPDKNGLLFAEQTPESLIKALRKFDRLQFDRAKIAASAQKFSSANFDQKIHNLIKQRGIKL